DYYCASYRTGSTCLF
nr:immunoglobulin light chain junction region [Macaca mulatta]